VPFFVNSNGNVGINNTAPAHRLDVNGDIHTTTTIRTPKIDFDDGSSMTSAIISYNDLTNTPTLFDGQYSSLTGTPTLSTVATSGSYNDLINTPTLFDGQYSSLTGTPTLFDGQYSSLTGAPSLATLPTFTPSIFKVYFDINSPANQLSDLFEPGAQGSFFGTQALNVGSYSYTTSAITIPASGVYEIAYTMLVRSNTDGGLRKINPTYIRVNNTNPDNQLQAIGSCYLRYNDTINTRENCQGASTILDLEQNDLISIWSYREGNSGTIFIKEGHITIKRIG
jgi:hypothetical protein